ncbi:MAG: hypothetical protein QG602_399 [Verrucomicrobiota bacterium]|nr:hypothetical protein [Verrucomicrobiota bacterium]
MKLHLPFLVLALVFTASSRLAAEDAPPAPAASPALAFKLFGPQSRLVYKLSNGGTLLIAFDPSSQSAGPIKFRYIFSDLGPVGIVTMSPEAVATATALHNHFEAGELTLPDKTSVWVSKKVFTDAKAGKSIELDLGHDGKVTFTLDPEGAGVMPLSIDYGCIPDSNDTIGGIETILLKSADGEKFIRLFDNEQMPLIVDMDTGSFRVRLSLHL